MEFDSRFQNAFIGLARHIVYRNLFPNWILGDDSTGVGTVAGAVIAVRHGVSGVCFFVHLECILDTRTVGRAGVLARGLAGFYLGHDDFPLCCRPMAAFPGVQKASYSEKGDCRSNHEENQWKYPREKELGGWWRWSRRSHEGFSLLAEIQLCIVYMIAGKDSLVPVKVQGGGSTKDTKSILPSFAPIWALRKDRPVDGFSHLRGRSWKMLAWEGSCGRRRGQRDNLHCPVRLTFFRYTHTFPLRMGWVERGRQYQFPTNRHMLDDNG